MERLFCRQNGIASSLSAFFFLFIVRQEHVLVLIDIDSYNLYLSIVWESNPTETIQVSLYKSNCFLIFDL